MSAENDSLQTELNALNQKIEAVQIQLANVLPPKEIEKMLEPDLQRRAAIISQLGDQNVIAQGENSSAVGERGAMARDVSGVVTTGDNNHDHQIIPATNSTLSPEEMREQIGNYLKWLIEMTGTIELRGIRRQGEQVVQLDLDTIYVPLAAMRRWGDELTHSLRSEMGRLGDDDELDRRELTLDQLLKLGQRQIISGGPGSGKTTVLLHLAWAMGRALLFNEPSLAEEKIGHQPDTPLLFPILVPLSRYAAHLRKLKTDGVQDPNESTLANFISRYLIEMQAGVSLPRDFYDQLLRDGRQILLLLDGLDEVPSEEERILVRAAIETLVSGREQLNVIVTCRTAAYQGRVALGKGFREIEVLPLEETHLHALIHNAYRAIESNGERAGLRAKELIESIELLEMQRRNRMGERAEALVVSPLLVRMLLIVHVSERRLPDRRAELYQKATEALISPDYSVDEHVAQEIARFVGDFSKHLSLVQYLAFHMHQWGDEQGREIEEDDLRDLLDEPDSGLREQRRPFLTTTRERGTLMEERLGLYRFIHLSFQEFLVARYIAEVIRDDGGQAAMLQFVLEEDRLLDSWWREPILLIIGYLSIDKHT
ncbi:MAG: NACHT domain-containing protein, partial [Chloroflexota bacterium]